MAIEQNRELYYRVVDLQDRRGYAGQLYTYEGKRRLIIHQTEEYSVKDRAKDAIIKYTQKHYPLPKSTQAEG